MKNTAQARQLWRVITDLNLDARHSELADYKLLIEQGLLEDDIAQDIMLQIDPLIRHAQDHPNPLKRPPSQEELYGDESPCLELGSILDASEIRFGLRIRDRPRNVLIAGNAGSGKTTTMYNIVEGVRAFNLANPNRFVSLVIKDTKLDYRRLAEALRSSLVHLSVHDPGTQLSLAAPEGVPANVWINLLSAIWCSRSGIVSGWTAFANLIRWVLAQLTPKPGTQLLWPSLKLLLEIMQASPKQLWGSKQGYEETLIGVLEAAAQATELFDCFGGLDLERDIIRPKKHLLLEMPNVAPAWLRQFILDLLIAQLLFGRIHRRQKTDRTELMLMLDEMDQDARADADLRFPDQMSPLAQLLRLGREFGIMAVIGLGRLNNASHYVQSEPLYHLIFNQSDAHSVVAARNTLCLPPEADQMFPSLTPGHCIAREAQGPWSHPMLVKIDHRPLGGSTPVPAYDTHPMIPAQSLAELPELRKALEALISEKRKTNLRQSRSKSAELSEHAHNLLNTASLHPWAPAATLWRRSGKTPSPRIQKAVRRELLQAGLADSEEVRLGSTNVLLYSITTQGWAYLRRQGPKRTGRGSISHQHISHWIALCGEKDGLTASCEFVVPDTNHAVDCAVEIEPGVCNVFEVVVTSKDNILQHLTTLATCECVRTIAIVCLQKRQMRAIRRSLEPEPVVKNLGDRLQWQLAETYMRRCFS